MTYPGDTDTSLVGRKYTYTYDSLGRPIKLTDDQQLPRQWAHDALYNPAGQITQLKYCQSFGYFDIETRSYNALRQVTQIQNNNSGTNYLYMQYIYSATQNNGQISQSIDSVSGETINYTYDNLNRLIAASTTGPQWGLSFSYDGFGNRLSQTVTKGSAPSSSLSVNAATNRIASSYYSYDSNGNLTKMPYGTGYTTLSYDIENRLTEATNSNGTERYAYGPDNRRVYQKIAIGTELVFFYGVNGDRLRTYQLQGINGFLVTKTNIYFAGRLIFANIGPIRLDRLGSVRNWSRYYPFGEEQGSGTTSEKFATYYRDTSTSLDYAINRYYGSTMGRFTTPDPYGGSARLGNPQSWNRYAYVTNDPINRSDPSGLDQCPPGDICIDVFGELPGRSDNGFSNVYQLWWAHANPMAQTFGFFPEYLTVESTRTYLHEKFNMNMRPAAYLSVKSLGQGCKSALAKLGISVDSLAETAATINFYFVGFEGTDLTVDLTGYSEPGKPNWTIADYLGKDRAATLLDRASNITNNVVIGTPFFTDLAGNTSVGAAQAVTFIHEALHVLTKLVDTRLAGFLGLGPNLPGDAASHSISEYLRLDCKPIK